MIDNIINKYDKIFIDTSSFLIHKENIHGSWEKNFNLNLDPLLTGSLQEEFFINTFKKIIMRSNKKISIPYEVIKELEKFEYKNKKKSSNALKILNNYKESNLLDIFKGENYPFTDNIFITIMFRYMTKYNICLITQDYKLGRDVSRITNFECIDYKKNIDAYAIGYRDNNFTLNSIKAKKH